VGEVNCRPVGAELPPPPPLFELELEQLVPIQLSARHKQSKPTFLIVARLISSPTFTLFYL
jgi:hypothetical protein